MGLTRQEKLDRLWDRMEKSLSERNGETMVKDKEIVRLPKKPHCLLHTRFSKTCHECYNLARKE